MEAGSLEPECTMKTMASHLQNKISVDVAADRSSADSFSFASLVCVQDQQAKSLQSNRGNQIHRQSTEFEFSTIEESFVCDPIKHCPADLLIPNGQIVPQPIKSQPTQHRTRIDGSTMIKQQRRKASVRATSTSSSRGSVDNTRGIKESAKLYPQHTDQDKKKHAKPSSWFGIKSFFFPCKETQAVNPTMRTNGKLH